MKLCKVTLSLSYLFTLSIIVMGQAGTMPSLNSVDKSSNKSIKEEMHETANLIIELQKYSTTIEKFGNPKNQKNISQILKALEKKSINIFKHTEIKTTAYRLSSEALALHLSELSKLYNDGSRVYARWMSLSTPMICASCHSQLPDASAHLWKLSDKDLNGSAIEKADLLFSTWSYDEALKIYDDLIRNFPSKASSENLELERAINKKLTLYLRVKRDPSSALKSFEIDLKNKKLPEGIAGRINTWNKSLKDLEKTQKNIKSLEKPENLLKFASSVYNSNKDEDENAPARVYASGLLYEALHEHSQDKYTPEFLYWLGSKDHSYNGDFHIGLAQNYLRECVVKFPESPIAKKCFENYASEERAQWTGTRGYDPPVGLEKDLKNLELKLKR